MRQSVDKKMAGETQNKKSGAHEGKRHQPHTSSQRPGSPVTSNFGAARAVRAHSSSVLGGSHKASEKLGIGDRLKKHFENGNAESY